MKAIEITATLWSRWRAVPCLGCKSSWTHRPGAVTIFPEIGSGYRLRLPRCGLLTRHARSADPRETAARRHRAPMPRPSPAPTAPHRKITDETVFISLLDQ